MAIWKVKALRAGTILADKSGLTHYRGLGTKIEVPIWLVAATDGKHKVLIDTGIDDINWIIAGPEPAAQQKPEEEVPKVLKRAMGWEMKDVDIVVNTHLHYDHCGCNYMCKNAVFYVQRSEYIAAFNPPAGVKALYAQRYFDKKAVPYFRWKFIDGELEILPGLLAFPTPGHTAGHQSVLFDIEEGAFCVTGDIANILENITANIETSIVVDAAKVYKSFESIRQKANCVLPGHDPSIANFTENGFPKID
jgi:glyoxylase-like metal-dependent hydrolase (beta-lactamase superfamily II)